MNALSLFSGIGVDEFYLNDAGINVVLANEVSPSRAEAYKKLHPKADIICGDIRDESIKQQIISRALENNVKLIIATPPCQGFSTAGKNKHEENFLTDERNFLIVDAIEIIKRINPDFVLFENVPKFDLMSFLVDGEKQTTEGLIKHYFGESYDIKKNIFHSENFKVPQRRQRLVYRIFKKGKTWNDPVLSSALITLREAIGNLPSLEPGDKSNIKNHFARIHPKNQILCMRHTPTGHSAFENKEFCPRKADGTKIKGFPNTYKRMKWDEPAPTITMRNECISSQENVHPGRYLGDGLWSDARILTLRELLIVSSLPADLDVPSNLSETSFRQLIGEGIPPLMLKQIIGGISV